MLQPIEVRILELIGDLHAADLADILDDLSPTESKALLQYVDPIKASDSLSNLDEEDRKKLLEEYTATEIAEHFIENLDSDDATDLIQELPEEKKEEVIANIDDIEQAGDIVDLLNYEDGTAGAIMGKELVLVRSELTVREAVVELRKQADEIENIYTIYVVNDDNVVAGSSITQEITCCQYPKQDRQHLRERHSACKNW